MADEIPEDVMTAANAEATRWFRRIGDGEYHFAEAIARAILAERERCAKIADDHAKASWGVTEEEFAAEAIASAIRENLA